ncbi:MAG: hypothetical protein NZ699_08605 [Roseiflexus sp.]|nr:hypothetical protein [Roseiflexus sp.]MCS7289178.1 hypothetical protein [Roseiflexus sp.]MDW8144779.1 hypothetical protein [Roseiflexaceae bacterium]MDW8232179.1 hypothetical protein [Roseiflexaceae bacterium]
MFDALLIILCLILVLAVAGVTGFIVALKLGVIVHQATKPTHLDTANYTLDQGREVRPEEERRN